MHYFIIRIWQQFISFRFFLVVACERESTFDFVSAQFLVMSEGKKKKYLQKCKLNYLTEFPCLKKSQRGDNYVFCRLCYCDFSIGHGGKRDIMQHFSSDKHLNAVSASKNNIKISNLFTNSKDYAVIRADAECFFTCFIVEHNLPLNCADHVGSLLRKMFPENEIAKKYSCARTKTSAIISEVAARSQKTLACSLKEQALSLATDGTNDTEFRSSLSDENLESLLLMKSNFSGNCYEQNFDKEFLSKAKSASYVKNQNM